MVEIAVETYNDVIGDIQPLFEKHWEEIAVYRDIPMEPDYDIYKRAFEAGRLVIYAVRDGGALVGYALFLIGFHKHYRTSKWAINDLVWLDPAHRGGGVGATLVEFWETDLRQRGVDGIQVSSKMAHPALRGLLRAKGYIDIEINHHKRIG